MRPHRIRAALAKGQIVIVAGFQGLGDTQDIVTLGRGGSDMTAPFGGYKMSGNGREWGDYAFHEFLETKAVLGYAPKEAAE